MDVIVVEDSVAQALLLERQITALGHTVRGARSGGKAVELLKERLPNLLVTDGILPELSGEALTRLVRSQDGTRYVYVLFVSGTEGPEAMKAAFAAGADDYMVKPLDREQLIARLRVADRISHLETRLRGRVRELESALRRLEAAATMAGAAVVARSTNVAPTVIHADDELVPRELAEKNAYRRMADTIRRMVGEFVQKEFAVGARPPEFQPALAREIALTSVSLVVELRIVLSVEQNVANELAVGLFGPDPDPALVEDTLAELANLAMGGVKASYAEEGVTLTSGLPSPIPLPLVHVSGALAHREYFFVAEDGTRMALTVEVARCPTRRARSFELTEGMILASPVTNAAGVLLVPGGVRLTTVTIEKIARTLPNEHFEVIASR
ncbi:MAG: response regulator [Sandaracinaceae bacterium]|nr:response regulator [Sandaracinaceae bacterium]